MAGTLATIDMLGPFSWGLNTQENASQGHPGFCVEAYNCVVDEQGRIAARKGFVELEATVNAVANLHRHEKKDSTVHIIYAGGGSVYRNEDTNVLKSAATADNWAFASLNGYLAFGQTGENLVVINDTTWAPVSVTATGFSQPNVLAVGYGRMWVADVAANDYVVYWCDLLDPTNWDTGDSGSLDLTTAFVNGKDSITGLTVFNNKLVIFCKNSIYVYAMPPDDPNPALMQLVDTIENVGCIARDSIQQTGNDVYFLSEAGLMSLGRLTQSDFAFPINNLTSTVKDQFINNMMSGSVNDIKSTYYPETGWYLITQPYSSTVWVFQTLLPVPEYGTPRITMWRDTVTPIQSMCINANGDLVVGMAGGYYLYSGYGDLTAPYEMTLSSQWLTFGEYSRLKHLKKMRMVIEGGGGLVGVFKWVADYQPSAYEDTVGLQMTANSTKYYYNVAEYNIAEYSGGVVLEEVYENIGGSGRAFKLTIQAPVSGEKIAIQTLQLFANKGKLA